MRSRTPAICLRTTDYSETSQIVVFLTRADGKVSLIAKGTRRSKSKSGGAIDLLSTGDLLYTRKNPQALGTLLEFAETSTHLPLRRDAQKLYAALLLVELADLCLAESDPHAEVYDLLTRSLERLAQPDAPVQAVVAWYQWRLLRHIGLLGGLAACVGCGCELRELGDLGQVYFSSRQGGLLCDGCHGDEPETRRLERNTLGALATLAAAEVGQKVQLPEAHALGANRLLNYHISQQVGRSIRMARHVLRA